MFFLVKEVYYDLWIYIVCVCVCVCVCGCVCGGVCSVLHIQGGAKVG